MTNAGRQWLFRIERRLAISYAENQYAEGRSEWTESLLQAWRLVNILRMTGKAAA